MANTDTASLAIAEWREFASFTAHEQRYIKRSLDVGLVRQDACKRWARDAAEAASIREQYGAYHSLRELRSAVPRESDLAALEPFMGKLICISGFDIAQDRLGSFSAYRFLYERLIGAQIRPWLPSAFCAAAALPQIRPERRKALLRSISEAAATAPAWSSLQPNFYPEWVEQVNMSAL